MFKKAGILKAHWSTAFDWKRASAWKKHSSTTVQFIKSFDKVLDIGYDFYTYFESIDIIFLCIFSGQVKWIFYVNFSRFSKDEKVADKLKINEENMEIVNHILDGFLEHGRNASRKSGPLKMNFLEKIILEQALMNQMSILRSILKKAKDKSLIKSKLRVLSSITNRIYSNENKQDLEGNHITKSLKQELNRTINMLMAHPDNEPNSEFCDRIDSLINLKEQLK